VCTYISLVKTIGRPCFRYSSIFLRKVVRAATTSVRSIRTERLDPHFLQVNPISFNSAFMCVRFLGKSIFFLTSRSTDLAVVTLLRFSIISLTARGTTPETNAVRPFLPRCPCFVSFRLRTGTGTDDAARLQCHALKNAGQGCCYLSATLFLSAKLQKCNLIIYI